LIDGVREHALNTDSWLHGPNHWRRVGAFGMRLCEANPAADAQVVAIFAAIHDSMRVNDVDDPEHGPRAAALAARLNNTLFELTAEHLETLQRACRDHADGRVTSDPTIGVCWDADRLDLWRLGISPDPALLSTDAGRSAEMIELARTVAR
jgi:uncharacterized protein